MLLTPELLAGLAVVFIIIVVALLFFRTRAGRTRIVQMPVSRGPANLRFTCAGCSEQFTHTKRTLGAWEKGTRRFYCNACHTKWRGSHPSQPAQGGGTATPGAQPEAGRRAEAFSPAGSVSTRRIGPQPARAGSGSGCLGFMVLLIAVPVAIVFVVVSN